MKSRIKFKRLVGDITVIFISMSLLCEISKNIALIKEKKEYSIQIKNRDEAYQKDAYEYKNLEGLDIPLKIMCSMYENGVEFDNTNLFDRNLRPTNMNLAVFCTGKGVCKNFSSDLSDRMNIINPDFNAVMVPTFLSNKLYLNNILKIIDKSYDGTFVDDLNEIIPSFSYSNESNGLLETNHAIVLFEYEGIIYYADPTNPHIGVVKDGNCYEFCNGEWFMTNDIKALFDCLAFDDKLVSQTLEYLIKSYKNIQLDDELGNKISIEFQNQELENMKSIKTPYTYIKKYK